MAPVRAPEEAAGGKPNNHIDPMKDVSWSGIFSQHEANMKAHLEVIGMIKSHVAEGSDSFSTICGMVDRTNELMRQLEAVRKEFLPSKATNSIFGSDPGSNGKKRMAVDIDPEDAPTRPRSSRKSEKEEEEAHPANGNGQHHHNGGKPTFIFDSKPSSAQTLPEHPKSRKRSRGEDTKVIAPEENDNLPTPPAGKRKKTKSTSKSREKTRSPPETVPAPTTPHPVETEDISAEVEARLRIKEESRQRKNEKAERKRKRESMNSNADEGVATSSRKPKKKKTRNGEGKGSGLESNGDGDSGKSEKSEKREKRRRKKET
ncbi:hypothetical protein FQN54_007979 [Arachnomyces sp. PD_36]|nr:hypothetical protein FQN54_007979 [Arachnomyces sp. PD_36]